MPELYHYTVGIKLRAIAESGYLRTSPIKPKPRERPVVWLSSNPLWEKTANKIIKEERGDRLLNQEETGRLALGLYRFVFISDLLDPQAVQWPRLAVQARLTPILKKRLLARARYAQSNPEQWWGYFGNLAIANARLQKWGGTEWEDITILEAISEIGDHNIASVAGKFVGVKNSDWAKA